jgi:hypothetical protein
MTEIENIEGAIKLLQSQLDLLRQMEKPESLEDILWDWWSDTFTSNSNLDMEATLADLADRVYKWRFLSRGDV